MANKETSKRPSSAWTIADPDFLSSLLLISLLTGLTGLGLLEGIILSIIVGDTTNLESQAVPRIASATFAVKILKLTSL